jgi:PAS domain S-box-containing protein
MSSRGDRDAKATGRELQVLELAAQGNTDKQIAQALDISKDTVASYWRRILLKYDAVSRTEVVARHARQNALAWMEERGRADTQLADEVTSRTKAQASELDQRNLLQAVTECSLEFISGQRGFKEVFDRYLQELLGLTESEYGFVAEVLFDPEAKPYLNTHAITNISWNTETRELYEKWNDKGLEFRNLDTLFGHVLTSRSVVITNDPQNHPKSGGLPHGHPEMTAFLGIPVVSGTELVGMIGLGSRPGGYDQSMVDYLSPLVATCANYIIGWRTEQDRLVIEQSLTENATLIQTLMESIPSAVLFEDQHRRIKYINGRFLQVFGAPGAARDYLGRHCGEVAKMSTSIFADPDHFLERVDELIKEDRNVYGEVVEFADGRSFERDFVKVKQDTTLLGYMWIYHKMSSLRQQQRTVSNVLNSSMDAVIVIDHSGVVEYWNSRSEAIFGYLSDEALGQSLSDLIVPEEFKAAHAEGLRRYFETREGRVMGQVIQIEGVTKCGSRVQVELLLSCIDSGAQPRYSAFIRKLGT